MVEWMNLLNLGYCGDGRVDEYIKSRILWMVEWMNILNLGYCGDGRVDEFIISRILWGW